MKQTHPELFTTALPAAELNPRPEDFTAVDWVDDTMMDRPLARVRQRLIAHVGHGVADWFHIVPSDRIDNQLERVALLLPNHLPILMPVHEEPGGGHFVLVQYDITGARLHGILADVDAVTYPSLADALLASGSAFEQLKEQFQQRRAECRVNHPSRELPEEKWLRHQLALCPNRTAFFGAMHAADGSVGRLC